MYAKNNVLFFQPNFAVKAAPKPLLERKLSQKEWEFASPTYQGCAYSGGLARAKLEPQ